MNNSRIRGRWVALVLTCPMLLFVAGAGCQKAPAPAKTTSAEAAPCANAGGTLAKVKGDGRVVLAALDELGFTQRTGLLFAILDSTIHTSIEGSVHLFNKRGLFSHG